VRNGVELDRQRYQEGVVAVKHWLLIASPHNYGRCLTRGLWGEKERDGIAGFRPGDRCIFYMTKSHMRLGAIVEISDTPRYQAETVWWDNYFPWTIEFALLFEPRVLVNAKGLIASREAMGFQGRCSVPIDEFRYRAMEDRIRRVGR
jgi:hypothetical protein